MKRGKRETAGVRGIGGDLGKGRKATSQVQSGAEMNRATCGEGEKKDVGWLWEGGRDGRGRLDSRVKMTSEW